MVSACDERRPASFLPKRHLSRQHFRSRVHRRSVQREDLLGRLGRAMLLRRSGADAWRRSSRRSGSDRRRRGPATSVRRRRGANRPCVLLLRRRPAAAAAAIGGQLQRILPARILRRCVLLINVADYRLNGTKALLENFTTW